MRILNAEEVDVRDAAVSLVAAFERYEQSLAKMEEATGNSAHHRCVGQAKVKGDEVYDWLTEQAKVLDVGPAF